VGLVRSKVLRDLRSGDRRRKRVGSDEVPKRVGDGVRSRLGSKDGAWSVRSQMP
jgi:hypothetical protein